MTAAAILFATVASADEGPAAVLRCGEATLLGRQLDQLGAHEVSSVWVITRPDWVDEVSSAASTAAASGASGSGISVHIRTATNAAEDLRCIADIAGGLHRPLIIGSAEILTHGEALAGLLADPRVASGILTRTGRVRSSWAFRSRSERGRVVSAASPYHRVRKPTGSFLNFIKIDPRDLEATESATRRMSALVEAPLPQRWQEEYERKRRRWRRTMIRSRTRKEWQARATALDDPAVGQPAAGHSDVNEPAGADAAVDDAALGPEARPTEARSTEAAGHAEAPAAPPLLEQIGLTPPEEHPQQGTPQRGTPQQGTPHRGISQQGTPQQGTPQQGGPQQGAPPQDGVPTDLGLDAETVDRIELPHDAETRLALRAATAESDVLPLVLVGLVRSQVHLTNNYLRELFWARPLSQQDADAALEAMSGYDEDRVLLDSAVKGNDGFFTTFFVSPYSKYIARWAARRGWNPNQVTTISMAMGVVAAVLFATGTRTGLIAGAVMLQVAFNLDCVDGQLARYTRTFSKFGAWLDSVFDRGKEYIAYAGLAVGAVVGYDDNVWLLAAAAFALQTVRHTVDFSFAAARQQVLATLPALPLDQPEDRQLALDGAADRGGRPEPGPEREVGWDPEGDPDSDPDADADWADTDWADADWTEGEPAAGAAAAGAPARTPIMARIGTVAVRASRALERNSWTRWIKKIVVLPIGERFALISVTAAIWHPQVTFVALLAWGTVALGYQLTGRMLRSVAA